MRPPPPVRNIVINVVTIHLVQTQTHRAIENQFVSHISRMYQVVQKVRATSCLRKSEDNSFHIY